jgi:hypothetical protein
MEDEQNEMENDDAEGERRVCDADGERRWKTQMILVNDDAEENGGVLGF